VCRHSKTFENPCSSVSVYRVLQQQYKPRSLLGYIVATVTSYHIVATMTLDNIVASDTTDAFIIPLVAMLTSSPVMCREEQLWNFSVLQSTPLQSCNFIR
jgi:hypothetical protein